MKKEKKVDRGRRKTKKRNASSIVTRWMYLALLILIALASDVRRVAVEGADVTSPRRVDSATSPSSITQRAPSLSCDRRAGGGGQEDCNELR